METLVFDLYNKLPLFKLVNRYNDDPELLSNILLAVLSVNSTCPLTFRSKFHTINYGYMATLLDRNCSTISEIKI